MPSLYSHVLNSNTLYGQCLNEPTSKSYELEQSQPSSEIKLINLVRLLKTYCRSTSALGQYFTPDCNIIESSLL